MPISIKGILSFLNETGYRCQYTGSFDIEINGFCALSEIRRGCITWIKNIDSYNFIDKSIDLGVVFVTQFFPTKKITGNNNIIQCKNPKETYFEILRHFFVKNKEAKIEVDSIIETDRIGKNVSIGHHCYISNDVIIGDNVIIKNNVVIECPTQIGAHTIIWSGVVIGADGFGYYQKEDGHNYKVPHFGGVKIGENVEIGGNTCIDRGTLADTIIGNNVKIDNLCHIAHNVIIEDDVMLTASVTLAGSSVVKENVYIAPGAIVLNQVTINKRAFVTVGAVTMKDVCENTVVFGNPARFLRNNKEDI